MVKEFLNKHSLMLAYLLKCL